MGDDVNRMCAHFVRPGVGAFHARFISQTITAPSSSVPLHHLRGVGRGNPPTLARPQACTNGERRHGALRYRADHPRLASHVPYSQTRAHSQSQMGLPVREAAIRPSSAAGQDAGLGPPALCPRLQILLTYGATHVAPHILCTSTFALDAKKRGRRAPAADRRARADVARSWLFHLFFSPPPCAIIPDAHGAPDPTLPSIISLRAKGMTSAALPGTLSPLETWTAFWSPFAPSHPCALRLVAWAQRPETV
jgi:hypothetical protein